MGPPPSKRQRRLEVLCPDDDAIEQSPVATKSRSKPIAAPSRLKRPTRSNGIVANDTFPTDIWAVETDVQKEAHGDKAFLRRDQFTRQPLAPAKANGERKGSIHAFLSKQPAAKPAAHKLLEIKTPAIVDVRLEDDIEDISDDDPDAPELNIATTQVSPSKPTRLVLDRRKSTPSSSQDHGYSPPASLKFRDFGRSGLPPGDSRPARTEDKRPWAERYGPETLEEVSVHKKKVSDVKGWLEGVYTGKVRQRLLILKGPSGSGKTATIRMLAKALAFDLSEWKNPEEAEFGSDGYASTYVQFEEFLGRSGRFGGLELSSSSTPVSRSEDTTSGSDRKAILVEEFPNTFVSSPRALAQFRSSILAYLSAKEAPSNPVYREGNIPLILIISETHLTASMSPSDAFTAHRLLGSTILNHPYATCIEFNPIASTYLLKALELVLKKEARHCSKRRAPGTFILKKLAEQGDVRSAIGFLEFLCLRGGNDDAWTGRVATKASKGRGRQSSSANTAFENESLEMVTRREANLGLFHAVGKVVYNKRDDPCPDGPTVVHPPAHLQEQHLRDKIPQTNPDTLMGEAGTDTLTFIAALHENYVSSCAGISFIDTLDACGGIISDVDILASDPTSRFRNRSFHANAGSEELRREEIAFQVAVRGLLFSLPYPVKRPATAYKMAFPTSVRLWRKQEEIEAEIQTWKGTHTGLSPWRSDPDGEQDRKIEMRIGLETTDQLLLERLPYLAKIQQSSGIGGGALEKLTGLGMENGHIGNGESDGDSVLEAELEPASKQQKDAGLHARTIKDSSLPVSQAQVEESVQKLYLSDDDIED